MTQAAPVLAHDSFVVDQMVAHVSMLIREHVYPRGGSKKQYKGFVADLMPKFDGDGNPFKLDPELFDMAFNVAYNRFFHTK